MKKIQHISQGVPLTEFVNQLFYTVYKKKKSEEIDRFLQLLLLTINCIQKKWL